MTTQSKNTMRRSSLYRPITLALLTTGLAAQLSFAGEPGSNVPAPSASAATEAHFCDTVCAHAGQGHVEDLHPFTHFASIPATADPETIRFERIRKTNVLSRRTVTADAAYCHNLQFRDPGGSMYCSYAHTDSPIPAYEVTYSYKDQPLASDEYGSSRFTFNLYFRPEELPADLRAALSASKVGRNELATYFNVSISHPQVRAATIDEANSSFCGGNYLEGNWIQNDPNCRDNVSVKMTTMPAAYISVEVEPVSPRVQQAELLGK